MVALVITVLSAVVSVVAAIFTARQAQYAQRQAVAAEEQAAAAKVQADLATAQLDQLKRAEDEEQAHQRWLEMVLPRLRTPGIELVQVAPGDRLHAEWALARGHVDPLSTSLGTAVILPAAERRMIPGSHEAKVRAARQAILQECASKPGAWFGWDSQGKPPEEGEVYLGAAQELDREGLVTARISNGTVATRITAQGSEAVRRGAF
jgi:hypothetical protein